MSAHLDYAENTSRIYKILTLLYFRRESAVQRLVGQVTDSEAGPCLRGPGYEKASQAKNDGLRGRFGSTEDMPASSGTYPGRHGRENQKTASVRPSFPPSFPPTTPGPGLEFGKK